MIAVVLTIHTILVAALVGVVLLQRSEGGGGLGMGGGGGGNFMSGRGTANVLTRSTTVLAALFFSTSLLLAIMGDRGETQEDVVRSLTGEEAAPVIVPGEADTDGLIDLLGPDADAATETVEDLIPLDAEEDDSGN